VDLNRAGTPLLEIVTQPEFTSADQVVAFARMLRNICRFLGVTEGVMQRGHMRFEPNINTVLALDDGRTATTPIVEIKNLNSFRSLKAAIVHEAAEQPRRWEEDRREMGRGQKRTMGWDDARGVTVLQREKEDAHDYRYFPDPDLPPVVVSHAWREEVRGRIPELPLARQKRYADEYGLSVKEAAAIVDERDVCRLYEAAIREMQGLGINAPRAGRLAANFLLQSGAKRANERSGLISDLPITPAQIAQIAALREAGRIGSNAADEIFGALCEPGMSGRTAEGIASARALLIVRDEGAMDAWCDEAIAKNEKVAADVRGGKVQAIGRLVGEVMKLSGGKADAKEVRERLLKRLTGL
jgi:aspartyl-tRNA(Asn)/glutamyl-tRNA(Gln) amidotransferase subunit B